MRITTCCHCIFFTVEIVFVVFLPFRTSQHDHRAYRRLSVRFRAVRKILTIFHLERGQVWCVVTLCWFIVSICKMLGEHRSHFYQGTSWADTPTQARIFWTKQHRLCRDCWARLTAMPCRIHRISSGIRNQAAQGPAKPMDVTLIRLALWNSAHART